MKKKKLHENLHEDFHKVLCEFCLIHDIPRSHILGFLSAFLIGTMAQARYSEEFGKSTFEWMYTQFVEKKKDFKD